MIRTFARSSGRRATAENANDEVILYRGMRDVQVSAEFLERGGTELAPMSTTADLRTAIVYGLSAHSVLLRLHTRNFMARGPEVSWLSCFPAEKEYLYATPPARTHD